MPLSQSKCEIGVKGNKTWFVLFMLIHSASEKIYSHHREIYLSVEKKFILTEFHKDLVTEKSWNWTSWNDMFGWAADNYKPSMHRVEKISIYLEVQQMLNLQKDGSSELSQNYYIIWPTWN